MKILRISICLLNFILTLLPFSGYSQTLNSVGISNKKGLIIDNIVLLDSSTIILPVNKPLFSFLIDNKLFTSGEVNTEKTGDLYSQTFKDNLRMTYRPADHNNILGWEGEIVFENRGSDTVSISNLVPFGEDSKSIYITGSGPENIARAWLFRPDCVPVRVILPDNAWELGYSSFYAGNELSVCAIARRTRVEGGNDHRYKTVLPPQAKVFYTIYADVFNGEWQRGLRMMFRDRHIYDTENFNDSIYKRVDLAWIKESYLAVFQMAWDREFFDRFPGKFNYGDFLRKSIDLFGNIDVFGIWATWPQFGLDERSQWRLYRAFPGGTEQLRNFIRMSHKYDTRFFLACSPWDNKSKKDDQFRGISQLVADTEADGILLDTRDSSSFKLQSAVDTVRKGVVLYSETMPFPKNMNEFISGRVHNNIYKSPELNLNKLIKPDFSIFRVCDVGEDVFHREIAVSFFNGYGTELNMFHPGGKDEHYIEDLGFLARTTFILRQNNDAFLDYNWTPMIETTLDSVFVNRWNSGDKTIYTILNMRASGVNGKLIKADSSSGKHYVSLWNHENVLPVLEKGGSFLPANAAGWQSSFSGTRKEGSVDCLAALPELIKSQLIGDSLKIKIESNGKLFLWKGNPSYQTEHKEFKVPNDTVIKTEDIFGFYEGKIVLQLIENKRLKDENIVILKNGSPWIISNVTPTKRSAEIPPEMVLVPGTDFSINVTGNENYITYPNFNSTIKVDSFLIDKYPVTNAQYYEFVINSGYRPADTSCYLRNWKEGMYKQGQDKYPVVWVSYEDMVAYSKWAGKRLPTQAEWQLAAQGTDNRKWPWGDEFHATYCNNAFNRSTPVDAFPKGQSIYGVFDLVGNVWQMTSDIYSNGSNYFTVIRGGSYFKPESDPWNKQGGPQPLDKTQILLMVSQSFDRSPTIGFRCVKDVDSKNFKGKK
ncbi:MAG: formylglycine-generating enzyme family protein [Bacteroidales bacterium]|nr:formylglycine-generating enzyme family protein [Bacteroidales bacterium]